MNPKQLMTFNEFKDTFVFGLCRMASFLVLLTLAWSIALVVVDVGLNRLFATWIEKNFDVHFLPTLSYVISSLMSLSTGTSFGTMAIMLSLVVSPAWILSNGDLEIFYLTVSGVLSGSILGDHVSPVSDTTLLSPYACRCKHMAHVSTQAPYALVPGSLAIFCGTLPVGFKLYSNYVGIIIGFISMILSVFIFGVKLINKGGRFDFFQELSMLFFTRPELIELKRDTAL